MGLFDALIPAIGIGKSLFGTTTKQDQTSTTRTEFRPEDLAAIEAARGGYQTQVGDLLGQLTRSREAIQKGFVMPSSQFQFSATPDAITRALAAAGQEQIAQNAAAARRNIPANLFSGSPEATRGLSKIADIQARLKANPLLFQAFQQQQGRELTQAQQQQSAAEAANRALMGREQFGVGLGQMGLGAQQNLLSTLLSLGQGLGTQVQTGQMRGRSGGLF